MPYNDEEYPGQPLWQSVLLFFCKGMIEGIVVILFLWLLLQVLFTRQLEVHLQILLLVGLIVFCLTLVLGCIVCWKKSQICTVKDKAPVTSAPAPAEPLTPTQSVHPSGATAASRQLYEELDGDTLEYPSTFTSPAPSQRQFTSLSFSNPAQSAPEENEQATSYFSLRRLSSPLLTAPLYKPIHPSRASLPTIAKPGLLTKTCEYLQRRCTVTGDARSYKERSRPTCPSAVSHSMPEKPIPLTSLSYGSSAVSKQQLSPKPCLHFTMAFSPEQQILTVTFLNLTGMLQRLEDVTVLGSLPPLNPCPTQATVPSTLSPEANSQVLLLKVNSAKELQRCKLRLDLYAQEAQTQGGTALGEVEVECGERDWKPEHPFHFMKELHPNNWNIENISVSRC
ncbi:uncharacterized protein syt18b [Odontesthes bonariensis]|uniref:uncharacterized protein syt18b n=1 Tax=Odontesthes bonariensis TaxID=219752 RepID=UPI003F581507